MRFFALLSLGLLASAAVITPAAAAPVEYVKVCQIVTGGKWAYIPGTDTCVNLETGQTVRQGEHGLEFGDTELAKDIRAAKEGQAIAMAMQNANVDAGKTFGVAVNVGGFDGAAAVGVSGAYAAGNGLTINISAGYGLFEGNFAARGGLNYAW